MEYRRDQATELLALRDRARAHLRKVEQYVQYLDAVCVQVEAGRRRARHRRGASHLRIVKGAVIAAVAASAARKLIAGTTVTAAVAAVTVTAVMPPSRPPQHGPRLPAIAAAPYQSGHAGRRRRKDELHEPVDAVAPSPAPDVTPQRSRAPGRPTPQPSRSAPGSLPPSPSPSLSPSPSVSPTPSPPPAPAQPVQACTLQLLGICVDL